MLESDACDDSEDQSEPVPSLPRPPDFNLQQKGIIKIHLPVFSVPILYCSYHITV